MVDHLSWKRQQPSQVRPGQTMAEIWHERGPKESSQRRCIHEMGVRPGQPTTCIQPGRRGTEDEFGLFSRLGRRGGKTFLLSHECDVISTRDSQSLLSAQGSLAAVLSLLVHARNTGRLCAASVDCPRSVLASLATEAKRSDHHSPSSYVML
jgi:hypothetical protein